MVIGIGPDEPIICSVVPVVKPVPVTVMVVDTPTVAVVGAMDVIDRSAGGTYASAVISYASISSLSVIILYRMEDGRHIFPRSRAGESVPNSKHSHGFSDVIPQMVSLIRRPVNMDV